MAIKTVRAKINEQWTSLTFNANTGQYEAEITAPKLLSVNREGGYYPVEMEAVNDTDTVTTVNDKTPVFGVDCQLYVDKIDAVTDRTQADVDRVKELNERYLQRTITDEELREWAQNLKGALNLSDLNRIEDNCELIGAFSEVTVSVRKWNMGDIPMAADYARIRGNIEKIRQVYEAYPNIPPTPTQPLNTYQKWNNIEKILQSVCAIYIISESNYYYGSEIYAGEGVGII